MKKEIIVYDTQDITRLGLRYLIAEKYEDAEIVDVENVMRLDDLLQKSHQSVVIIDPAVLGQHPTEDIITYARNNIKVQWVVFSNDISDVAARRMSSLQNISLLLKTCHQDEITSGIVLAMLQQRFICHRLMDILLNGNKPTDTLLSDLSATEIEILRLTAMGKTVKEIANERISSVHTITTHKRNIFKKLKVNTSYEATMVAAKAGLIDLIEYYI